MVVYIRHYKWHCAEFVPPRANPFGSHGPLRCASPDRSIHTVLTRARVRTAASASIPATTALLSCATNAPPLVDPPFTGRSNPPSRPPPVCGALLEAPDSGRSSATSPTTLHRRAPYEHARCRPDPHLTRPAMTMSDDRCQTPRWEDGTLPQGTDMRACVRGGRHPGSNQETRLRGPWTRAH